MDTVMSRPGHAAFERPDNRPAATLEGSRLPYRAYRHMLDEAATVRERPAMNLGQLIRALEQAPASNVAAIDWDGAIFHATPGHSPNYPGDLVIEIGAEVGSTVADLLFRLRLSGLPSNTDVWAEWWGRTTDTQVHGVLSYDGLTVLATSAG